MDSSANQSKSHYEQPGPDGKSKPKASYPSFGSKEKRELKLIKEELAKIPGPGSYQLNFNLDDLLQKCSD